MDKIIFDPKRCRQDLFPLLQKSWKVLKVEVDRKKSDIDRDKFRLLITIDGIKGPVALIDTISSIDLPSRSPLCVKPGGWFLTRFLQDTAYRNQFAYDAVDAALQSYKMTIDAPTESEFDDLCLDEIETFDDLAKSSFSFLSYDGAQQSNAQYYTATEAVALRRLLTPAQLQLLWEKSSRGETWHDRDLLF